MSAYYNEFDKYAAAWLRELIKAGLIADGDVDERSIKDVRGSDLAGYTQCHFFAGIGGWSYGLRLAGWPDSRPVWTGSCPCQPFANPGMGGGASDERHLWPELSRLIREQKPSVVFGEQVESPLGRRWLESVLAEMEGFEYAVGAAGLPAAGIGAPQGRLRLWWVADSNSARWQGAVRKGKQNPEGKERASSCRESLRPDSRPWPPGPCEIDKIPLLVNGVSGVVGGCKGYGNAIVPKVAAHFIAAFMECEQ